jgi:hypothetical protein
MYLVDTNIWLEIILKQEKFESAISFLSKIDNSLLFISEFSLYSIGVILSKFKKFDLLKEFFLDVIEENNIEVLRINPSQIDQIIEYEKDYNIDFDDAYQCLAAELYNLTIISFDEDFKKTNISWNKPDEL